MATRNVAMSDARATKPAGFNLVEYAQRTESGERPTLEIPGVELLTLLAETAREEGDGSRIEIVELDPDDVILEDDGRLAVSRDADCADDERRDH